MKDILLVAGLLTVPLTVSVHQYHQQPVADRNDPRLRQLQQYFAQRD